MLIRATRTASALTLRALFYGVLFVVVVLAHLALTGALRAQGWSASLSLLASGLVVLAVVLVLVHVAEWLREQRASAREIERMRQGLPGAPCCVVWSAADARRYEQQDMPWDIVGAVRARYPKLARALGVEGVAVAEFEVSAEGKAKNVHLVYAWPSDVFFDAAREALEHTRFQPKPETHVRYGASYRLSFVFRIAGAAKLNHRGRRARELRPALNALQRTLRGG